jgi:hypothetical protein
VIRFVRAVGRRTKADAIDAASRPEGDYDRLRVIAGWRCPERADLAVDRVDGGGDEHRLAGAGDDRGAAGDVEKARLLVADVGRRVTFLLRRRSLFRRRARAAHDEEQGK